MSRYQRRSVFLATLSVTSSLFAVTAHSETLPERIEACVRNADDAERLKCFDAAAEAWRSGKLSAGASAPAAAANPATSNTPEVQTAKIASVTQPSGQRYRIVLDNDQVWQETEHVYDLELMPGQTVRIKAGVLNSYFLSVDSGRSTRVRRVK